MMFPLVCPYMTKKKTLKSSVRLRCIGQRAMQTEVAPRRQEELRFKKFGPNEFSGVVAVHLV